MMARSLLQTYVKTSIMWSLLFPDIGCTQHC
jgi:hypothetical protein